MKIAICDDDLYSTKQLKKAIENCLQIDNREDITLFSSAEELLEAYERNGARFDLLFLDIKMKKLSGLDAARMINNIDDSVLIFLVTAYSDYVFEGYEVRAFRYILKPFTQEQISRDVRAALKTLYSTERKYTVHTKSSIVTFSIDNIYYLESIKRQICVVSNMGKMHFYSKLSTEEEKLRPLGFVRVHQGYLVNMMHIKTIIDNNIYLANNEVIPISKSRKKDTLRSYTKYLTEYEGI